MAQVRNWIGTLFIQDGFNASEWMQGLFENGEVAFVCGQLEQCPKTGRIHLQYMIQMDRSRQLARVRKISAQTHWEPVRGSCAQARAYCTKEETRVDGPWEFGQMTTQGKRRGLEEAIDAVKLGNPIKEIASEFSMVWVGHYKGLLNLRQTLGLEADRRQFGPEGPEVWVLWGPTGTGKSRFAAEQWPDAFWKAPDDKWWDGYNGQETVIIDDFKDYGMKLLDMQRLLDRYPLWVEVKGGSVPMLAKRYVLTSNTHPDEWYAKADPGKTLMRRIKEFAEDHGRLICCASSDWKSWTQLPEMCRCQNAEVSGNTRTETPEPFEPLPDLLEGFDFGTLE